MDFNISSQAVNHFSGNLFNNLVNDGHTGNALASPLGLITMLSMIMAGSKGRTQEQIAKVMNVESNQVAPLHKAFQKMVNILDREPDQVVKYLKSEDRVEELKPFTGYDLFTRSMAFATGVITEDYMTFLKNFYKAEMKYSATGFDGVSVMDQINDWVNKTTYGRIPSVLNEPPTIENLILINSVFFSAKWVDEFRSSGKEDFLNDGVNKVQVEMMNNDDDFYYAKDVVNGEEVEILELPYHGSSSMVAILPKSPTGINNLFKAKINQVVENFDKNKTVKSIEVTFPKFKIETTLEMAETLNAMGVKDLMSSDADLSGMTGSNIGMFMSGMTHKTKIEVDEEGTVAAAVTITTFETTSIFIPEIKMTFDRPFALVLRDTVSNMILFVGKVAEL